MTDLFWRCHICGEERPDARISVVSTDMSQKYDLPPGTMKQNVRYCNDKPECHQGALAHDFTKGAGQN